MSTKILVGDARERLLELPDESVQCVVTSPPYWGLRHYNGDAGMIGMESTFEIHLQNLVDVFSLLKRKLRQDGTVWLNYGDAYAGGGRGASTDLTGTMQFTNRGSANGNIGGWRGHFKERDLILMPARIAIALSEAGWYLRSEIIWHKPNPMPEPVKNRPTCSHEKVYLLTKEATRYYYDDTAVRTRAKNPLDDQRRLSQAKGNETLDPQVSRLSGRQDKQSGHGQRHAGFNERYRERKPSCENDHEGANLRNVWSISPAQYSGAHFAVMPNELVEICIKAGTRKGDTVLDPFGGAGTVALVAENLEREGVLIEISPDYAELAKNRIQDNNPLFGTGVEIL